jgi:hypothetical protein
MPRIVLPLELQPRLIEHSFVLVGLIQRARSGRGDSDAALLQDQAAAVLLDRDIVLRILVWFSLLCFLLLLRFTGLDPNVVIHHVEHRLLFHLRPVSILANVTREEGSQIRGGGGNTTGGGNNPADTAAFSTSSCSCRAAASFSLSSVACAIASSSFLRLSASFERVGMLGAGERGSRVNAVAVKTMGRQLEGTLTPNLVKADTMHRMSAMMFMMMGVGCCGIGEKGYVNLWAQKI